MWRYVYLSLMVMCVQNLSMAKLPCEELLEKTPPKNKLLIQLEKNHFSDATADERKAIIQRAARGEIALGIEGSSYRERFGADEKEARIVDYNPTMAHTVIFGIEGRNAMNLGVMMNNYLVVNDLRAAEKIIRGAIADGHDVRLQEDAQRGFTNAYKQLAGTLLFDEDADKMLEHLTRSAPKFTVPESLLLLKGLTYFRKLDADSRDKSLRASAEKISIELFFGVGELSYHLVPLISPTVALNVEQRMALSKMPARYEQPVSREVSKELMEEITKKLRDQHIVTGIAELYCKAVAKDPGLETVVIMGNGHKPAIDLFERLVHPRKLVIETKVVQ
jgi:hypothetical protein